MLSADAVAAADVQYLLTLNIDNLIFQMERGLLDLPRGIGITPVKCRQEIIAKCHPQP